MKEIEGNTWAVLVASFGRTLAILLTGATTLIGVLGSGDTTKISDYLQGNEFVVFGTALVGAAVWAYGLWKQHKRNEAAKAAGVIAQAVAPNVVQVKGTIGAVDPSALAAKMKEDSL